MTTADPSKQPDSTADVDTADSADDREKLRQQLEELGYTQPVFRDESLAPEVDQELVGALVRRELPEETASLVFRLIYSFRSWHDAHTQALIEQYREAANEEENPKSEIRNPKSEIQMTNDQ